MTNAEANLSQSTINRLVEKAVMLAEELGFGYEPVAVITADTALFPLPGSLVKLPHKTINPQKPLLSANPWR